MSEKLKEILEQLFRKLFPSCKDITALASKSLETKLSWHETLKFKYHLWLCLPCNRYLSHLKFIRRFFEIEGNKSSTLSSEASERIKNALKSSKLMLIFAIFNCCL